MSIERVRAFLKKENLDHQILEFDVSSATVELAAQALGVEGAKIAKTLSFRDGDGCLLVVTAGDAKIDNKKFRNTFSFKARFLTPDETLELTGHAIGGVCPFALPEHAPVYLDVSLKRFDYVFPACGSANSAIKLEPEQMYALARARGWVDVCKDWQPD